MGHGASGEPSVRSLVEVSSVLVSLALPPESSLASSPATVLTVPLLLPPLLPFFLKAPTASSSATLALCASVMCWHLRQPPLHFLPHPLQLGM